MTKYGKVKKLMAELEIDKQDATKLLRDNGWNYGAAVDSWMIQQKLNDIDWLAICDALSEAILYLVERVSKAFSAFVDAAAEFCASYKAKTIGGDDYVENKTDARPTDTV